MRKPTPRKARSRRALNVKTTASQPEVRPHCAGIDVGSSELYVAVPSDAAPQPVRTFGTFTPDLHTLADWLEGCRVRSVALESTGVYWIPIFQVLEARGFEVCLVNARHAKNAPGRKTDVLDCQWLQYLHSVGLLRASFRPPAEVCALRTLWRHRDGLVRSAARETQHMQKAMTQMNLQLANVLSDLTGETGMAIIDAILAGERDGAKLAALRNYRVKADAATIAKSLAGTWKASISLPCARRASSTPACRRSSPPATLRLPRICAALSRRSIRPKSPCPKAAAPIPLRGATRSASICGRSFTASSGWI